MTQPIGKFAFLTRKLQQLFSITSFVRMVIEKKNWGSRQKKMRELEWESPSKCNQSLVPSYHGLMRFPPPLNENGSLMNHKVKDIWSPSQHHGWHTLKQTRLSPPIEHCVGEKEKEEGKSNARRLLFHHQLLTNHHNVQYKNDLNWDIQKDILSRLILGFSIQR